MTSKVLINRAKRHAVMETNIWQEYEHLAKKYTPIDLGLGFSDCPLPKFITEAFASTANSPDYLLNQYTHMTGHLRLVKAISTLYSKLTSIEIDPINEILVTAGATGALYATLQTYIDDGDEVIIIEPYFEIYEKLVKYAGGVPRFISLRPQENIRTNSSSQNWKLDQIELESLFCERTKAIILNNPNNPLGKVFKKDELMLIAGLCKKWNVLCISDEVYEWLCFNDSTHTRICALAGMWERTITIGSVGKSFSVTGWKIGWAYGCHNLIKSLRLAHLVTCGTQMQEAAAIAFEHEIQYFGTDDSYFKSLKCELIIKRNFVVKFLSDSGFHCIVPQGGYFIIVDWSNWENKIDVSAECGATKDIQFTKWLTRKLKVLTIPACIFFNKRNENILPCGIRVCFFKSDESLVKAADVFKKNMAQMIAK